MHRLITRLIDAQRVWAGPLGEFVQRYLERAFTRFRPAKDALNGVWLGHPLHPLLTDVPVGALTTASLLDVLGQRKSADIALATGVAGMAASAVAGLADGVDTFGDTRLHTTVHATVMSGSLALYLASLGVRALRPGARPLAVLLSMAGYAGMAAGAYIGGDLVFRSGNNVDRHAWDGAGKTWRSLGMDDIPEGGLVAATAGKQRLVLFRDGASILALDDVCAHQGGLLHAGSIVDGCVECPIHGSRFRLSDGRVVRGPSVYDQPAFEVRRGAAGLEARRRTLSGE